MPPFLWWRFPLCLGIGAGTLWWLVRRATGDRRLVRVVLGSFGLRVVLGAALYLISYHQWPILRSLQMERGFWLFGLDSHLYHAFGIQIADAWVQGIELPNPELGIEYFALVAAIYRFLGPSPLYPLLLNSWFAALTGLLAYLIGRRLFHQRAAMVAAVLVSFWPSSLLWSGQLLKDALNWLLMFAAIAVMLVLASPADGSPGSRRATPARWLGWCLVLAALVMLCTRLRFYIGTIFSLAAIAVLAPAACAALLRQDAGRGLRYAAIALTVVLSTLFARTFNTFKLLSPAHPERGHFRLAVAHSEEGRLLEAAHHFERAIALDPAYEEAYFKLGDIYVQQGNRTDAARIYADYLKRPDALKRQEVTTRLFRIYLDLGRERLQADQIGLAVEAYAKALQVKPDSGEAYAGLGAAMEHRGDFDVALAAFDKALPLVPPGPLRQYLETAHERVHPAARAAAFALARAAGQVPAVVYAAPIQLEAGAPPTGKLSAISPPREAETATPALPQPDAAQPLSQEHPSGQRPQDPPTRQLPHDGPTNRFLQATAEATGPLAAATSGSPEPLANRVALNSRQEVRNELAAMAAEVLPFAPSSPEIQSPSETSQETPLHVFAQHLAQLDDQILVSAAEATPASLGSQRAGFVAAGGYSLMDAWAKISSPAKLVTYLPRALLIGLLAPFPPQWLDLNGSTGIMRGLSGGEMVLLYLLLPACFIGAWGLMTRRSAIGLVVLAVIGCLLVGLSLVVANLGTLFRLRLLFLLPLMVVAAGGDPLGCYRRLWERVSAGRLVRGGGRRAPISEGPTPPGDGARAPAPEDAIAPHGAGR